MSLARKIGALFGASGTAIDASFYSAGSAPTGTMVPFAGTSAPSGWFFCAGQAVPRADYVALFAVLGTTYGAGDGSTTFNLPDMRGRVAAGKDDMGGTAAGRLAVTLTGTKASTSNGNITGLSSTAGLSVGMKAFGTGIGANAVIKAITSGTSVTLSVNSTSTGSTSIRFAVVDGATLGAVGGSHAHALSVEQMPSHTHTTYAYGMNGDRAILSDGGNGLENITSSATGGGQAHPIVQPTIVLNYIIKT